MHLRQVQHPSTDFIRPPINETHGQWICDADRVPIINTVLMQHQKKRTRRTRKQHSKSEYGSYQPRNHLTIYFRRLIERKPDNYER